MSFADLGIGALALYLFGMLVLAEFANRARRDLSPSDHFLAGRELGVFVLFLTLYATAYSGNSLLGYPGKAYRSGFAFVMATGFMMSIVVVFHALVPRLRPISVARAFITPGDWVRHRFGEGPCGRVLLASVGVLMSFALANFLLAQLKAMGDVTSLVTENRIPYEWGVAGLAGIILLYETRGGMRAVAWTDAAQGILMLLGLAALLAWLLGTAGGLGAITRDVARVRPEAVAIPDAKVCAGWFSTTVLLGLASVLYPQAIQRIYAARSGRVLSRSLALMTFMPLATTLVVTLIGIAAISRLELPRDAASDGVMPLLLGSWATSGLDGRLGAVLVFVGALSAIMSTADSCLLSLGSVVERDLLGLTGDDARSTRIGKMLAGGILLAMIPLAWHREISLWRLIELKMELLIQCVPCFLMALHWKRQNGAATLVGLLAGTAIAVGLTWAGWPRVMGIHAGVLGLVVNASIVATGSLGVGILESRRR